MASQTQRAGALGEAAPNWGRLAERLSWWCFLALVFVVPLAQGNLAFAGTTISNLVEDQFGLPKATAVIALAWMAAALWALSVALGPKRRVRWHWLIGVAGISALWTIVTSAFSVSPGLSLVGETGRTEGAVVLVSYSVVIFLAVQLVDGSTRLRTVLRVIVAAGVLVALYMIAQQAGRDVLVWATEGAAGRPFSTLGNPDVLGVYLLMPAIAAVGLAISAQSQRLRAIDMVAFAVLLLGSLGLSLVREAWVGAVAAVAVAGILAWRLGWRPAAWQLLAAGAVLALGLLTLVGVVLVQPNSVASLGRVSSVTERLDAWQLGLSAVLSRPIFGYGPSSFERVATLFADSAFYARYGMRPWVDSAHNYFVHIAASEGVIGVALFALLTIGALVTGWRRALSSRSAALTIALTATLAGALVASLACVTDIAVSFTIASMVGLVTATVAEPREVTVPWARAVAVGVAVLTAAALGFGALLIVGETTYVQAVQSPDPAAQLAGMRRAVQLVPSSLYYRRRLAQTLTATFVASADRQAPPEELRRAADNAEQAAFDAARFDPWSVDARLELLGVLNDANSHVAASTAQHSALAEAKDAAVRWPHNPGVALQLAYAAYDAGDISGSNAALERALAAAPQSVEVWMRLAQNAEHEHHLPEAMRAYRHVISIDPANPAARDSLQRLSAHATPAP